MVFQIVLLKKQKIYIRELLKKKGADLAIYDSWYIHENNVNCLEEALNNAKAIVLITDHDDIVAHLKKTNFSSLGIEVVVDGRNVLDGEGITRQGILYSGIGR